MRELFSIGVCYRQSEWDKSTLSMLDNVGLGPTDGGLCEYLRCL
jgi:hypothetical protein